MRGSIKRRGRSWKVVVDVGQDPSTGRRKQHFETFRTRAEADDRLAELLAEARRGTYVKPTRETVADWLRKWLGDYAAPSLRATTLRGYTKYVEQHIIPTIGHVRLGDLRPDHVKKCHAAARDRGLSGLSVLHVHRVLSKALNEAVASGRVFRNVATIAKAPRVEPRPKVQFRPEEIRRFLAAARGTQYFEPLLLDLFLGLRRSELLGLRWEDIDLDRRRVSIRRSLHYIPRQGIVVYPPKNAASERDVALSDTTYLLFRALRDRAEAAQALAQTTLQPQTYVFANPTGKPMSPNTLSMATRKIATRAGLPHVHLHTLRHWAASVALGSGATLMDVREHLGHSTIRTTADIYSHLEDKRKAAHASVMEEGVKELVNPLVSNP